MNKPLLQDAFGHHTWATLRLIDACLGLSPEQLDSSVPGTYGSILATMRHIVGGDAWYLETLSRNRFPGIDEDQMDLTQLRAAMDRNGSAWDQILAEDADPDTVYVARGSDGFETHAPVSIRLAQALHHGTDHRSQICTALTTLGIEPPFIDVWDYGMQNGRVTDSPPTA